MNRTIEVDVKPTPEELAEAVLGIVQTWASCAQDWTLDEMRKTLGMIDDRCREVLQP